MSKWKIAAISAALIAVALSLINASWLAPAPRGRLIMIAHHGIIQPIAPDSPGDDACTARRIGVPEHNYIENTVRSIVDAASFGADMIQLDVQPTKDGHLVIFQDDRLDCRTNGRGRVGDHDLAQLQALDIGHGYTADGGKTFPLRGRGIGMMPTVEQVLRAAPRMPLMFQFKSSDERQAGLMAAAFQRAGVVADKKYAFHGDERIVARLRRLAPASWAWSDSKAQSCASDYLQWGWVGRVPPACRGGTALVSLDSQWKLWGWPKRFLARMAGADARVVVAAGHEPGRPPSGLERGEQLGEVPRDFRGHLLVEDIYTVGRALQN